MGLVGIINRSRGLVERRMALLGAGIEESLDKVNARLDELLKKEELVLDKETLSELIQAAASRNPKVKSAAAFIGTFAAVFYGVKEISYAIMPHLRQNLDHQMPFMSLALAASVATIVYIDADAEKNFREFGLEADVVREFKLRFGQKRQISHSKVMRFIAENKFLFSLMFIVGGELAVFGSFFLDALTAASPGSIYDLNFPEYFSYAADKMSGVLRNQPISVYPMLGAVGYAAALCVSIFQSWTNISLSYKVLANMLFSKLTGNASHLTKCLEGILERNPSKFFRYMLAQTYLRSGRVDDGLKNIKAGIDYDEPLGFEGTPLVGSIKSLVNDAYSTIRRGVPTQASYLELSYLCSLIGDVKKSEEVVSWMVEKFKSPEDCWLAALLFHRMGNAMARNGYLRMLLPMLYADPERFRVELLGENAHANDVFRISHPLLRDDIILKAGRNKAALMFEYERDEDAIRLIGGNPRYPAVEPMLIDRFGRRPVYVMSLIKGAQLANRLESGEAGIDEVLSAWELTEILHGIDPAVSRVRKVTMREKLYASLSAEHLGLPEETVRLVVSCADAVEELLSAYPVVFNTDGTPANRIVSSDGKKMTAVDLEDKGAAYLTLEMANLLRWRQFPHTDEIEKGVLAATRIEEAPYFAAVFAKSMSLYSFFSSPSVPSLNRFAPEKPGEALAAIERIRNAAPISFAKHRTEYMNAVNGLQRLAERPAA